MALHWTAIALGDPEIRGDTPCRDARVNGVSVLKSGSAHDLRIREDPTGG